MHARLLALALCLGAAVAHKPSVHKPSARFMHKTSKIASIGAARATAPPPPSSTVLYPTAFGADPTGMADSLSAFEKVLAAAWRPNPSGAFTNGPDNSAIIDLQGGSYSFSAPLLFPAAGGGGVKFQNGVIRASPTFPLSTSMNDTTSLLMLTNTNASSSHDGGCCWYEFIYFENLVLDGGLRTGCARVSGATRIIFDEVFFTGYRTTGI